MGNSATQFYRTRAYIVVCTRNRRQILDNEEIFELIVQIIINICDKLGAAIYALKRGVVAPNDTTVHDACAIRLVLDITGTSSAKEIVLAIKKEASEKLKERFPNYSNPFTKDFLIMDGITYTEEAAYQFVNSSTWRTGGGDARSQKLREYFNERDHCK